MKASVSSGAGPWVVKLRGESLLGLRSSANRPTVAFSSLLSIRV